MNTTITVIGNVGSGKTTLSKILATKLPGVLIDADPYESNPFLPLYAEDHLRWALATELYFTQSRATQLSKELLKNKSKVKIIDSGLLMGIEIYAKHHRISGSMTSDEWSLFKNLTDHLLDPRLIYPDQVIYCRCDINTCLTRIAVRGRKFEAHHTRKYLTDLQSNLDVLYNKLIKLGIPVVDLDMTKFDPRNEINIATLIKSIKSI